MFQKQKVRKYFRSYDLRSLLIYCKNSTAILQAVCSEWPVGKWPDISLGVRWAFAGCQLTWCSFLQ
jgi:hypothetical protein